MSFDDFNPEYPVNPVKKIESELVKGDKTS
jgi:hypothetical protein